MNTFIPVLSLLALLCAANAAVLGPVRACQTSADCGGTECVQGTCAQVAPPLSEFPAVTPAGVPASPSPVPDAPSPVPESPSPEPLMVGEAPMPAEMRNKPPAPSSSPLPSVSAVPMLPGKAGECMPCQTDAQCMSGRCQAGKCIKTGPMFRMSIIKCFPKGSP